MPLRPIGDSGQSLRPGKSPLASEKRHFVGNRSGELSSRMLSGKQIRKTRENANDSSTPQAASQNRSVPRRPPNGELRSRKYLTKAEVEKLIKAARNGRYGHLHGLRAVEICDLEWSQVEFGRSASLHVRRAKNGKPSVHPLRGDDVRALRELRRQFPDSAFVFPTERGGPVTSDAVNRLIKRMGSALAMISRSIATCSAMPADTGLSHAHSRRRH
jgi:integrase